MARLNAPTTAPMPANLVGYQLFIGLDISLTCTGVAAVAINPDTRHVVVTSAAIKTPSPAEPGYHGEHLRLNDSGEQVRAFIAPLAEAAGTANTHAVIEAPAMNYRPGRSGKVWERAGLWWLIYAIADVATADEVTTISPATLKKFGAAHGAAKKADMFASLQAELDAMSASWEVQLCPRRLGTNDERDAAWMALLVAGWYIDDLLDENRVAAALAKTHN